MGTDRIVGAAAAYKLYGGPVIVVDFGSATTFNLVTKDGVYLGGAIAPGIKTATESLVTTAAKLPRIELEKPQNIVGTDTKSCMQSGIVYGYTGLVKYLVDKYKELDEMKGAKVVATGGLSELVENVEPDLIDVTGSRACAQRFEVYLRQKFKKEMIFGKTQRFCAGRHMKKIGVALLGLGVVGGGTYEILRDKREMIKANEGLDIEVKRVLERNLARCKELGVDESIVTQNIDDIVNDDEIQIVAEFFGGVEPAKSFLIKALQHGKSVVTANKEMFAKSWHELEIAAKKSGAGLYFEASCVGGVPVIRTLTDSMQANSITSLKGIVNGTTNYILSKMSDEGVDYQTCLKEAQKLGYAEANPTADVEGFDSTYKNCILSSLAYKKRVPIDKIYREGISNISVEDIAIGKRAWLRNQIACDFQRHGRQNRGESASCVFAANSSAFLCQRLVQRTLYPRRQR